MKSLACITTLVLFTLAIHAHAQTRPTLTSPLSGTFSSPPTFRFTVNTTGCYIIVVSNSSGTCTTNGTGLDWVHSFGPITAGTPTEIAIPQADWNKLNSGTLWWHVSFRQDAPCQPSYPLHSESCPQITKACTGPTGQPTAASPCGGTVNTQRPELVWNGNYGYGTYYHVQVATNPSFAGSLIETDMLTYVTTRWIVSSNLTDGITYYWRVRAEACNPRQMSNWSSTCSVTVQLDPTITITSPGTEPRPGGSSLDVAWTAQRVDKFNVELSTDNGTTWTTKCPGISARSCSFTLPNPTEFARFCVRVSDAAKPSVYDKRCFDVSASDTFKLEMIDPRTDTLRLPTPPTDTLLRLMLTRNGAGRGGDTIQAYDGVTDSSFVAGITDVSGTLAFRYAVAPPVNDSVYRLVFSATEKGFTVATRALHIDFTQRHPLTLLVLAPTSDTLVTRYQDMRWSFECSVESDGKPVVGATVAYQVGDVGNSSDSAITNEAGVCTLHFQVDQSRPDSLYAIGLKAAKPGYVSDSTTKYMQVAISLTEKLNDKDALCTDLEHLLIDETTGFRWLTDHFFPLPTGYSETLARNLLAEWRAYPPADLTACNEAMRRLILAEYAVRECFESELGTMPGARELADEIVTASGTMLKNLIAVIYADHELENINLHPTERELTDMMLKGMMTFLLDGLQQIASSVPGVNDLGVVQIGWDFYGSVLSNGHLDPNDIAEGVIGGVIDAVSPFLRTVLLAKYIRKTQEYISIAVNNARQGVFTGDFLTANAQCLKNIDTVKQTTAWMKGLFGWYQGICRAIDIANSVVSLAGAVHPYVNVLALQTKLALNTPVVIGSASQVIPRYQFLFDGGYFYYGGSAGWRYHSIPILLNQATQSAYTPTAARKLVPVLRKPTINPNSVVGIIIDSAVVANDHNLLVTELAALETSGVVTMPRLRAIAASGNTRIAQLNGMISSQHVMLDQVNTFDSSFQKRYFSALRTTAWVTGMRRLLTSMFIQTQLSQGAHDTLLPRMKMMASQLADSERSALNSMALARLDLPSTYTFPALVVQARGAFEPKMNRVQLQITNIGTAASDSAWMRLHVPETGTIQTATIPALAPGATYLLAFTVNPSTTVGQLQALVRLEERSDTQNVIVYWNVDAAAGVSEDLTSYTPMYVSPSPARTSATLHFALAYPQRIEFAVEDAIGRTMIAYSSSEVLPAGEHNVPIDTRDWASGIYYCRITVDGASRLMKICITH